MWLQFILENAHFAINLLTALVFFAVSWLYFDAWLGRKSFKEVFKVLGFLLISISYLTHAVFVEASLLEASILTQNLNFYLVTAFRICGYILVITSLAVDPLQPEPKVEGLGSQTLAISPGVLSFATIARFLYPILAFTTSFFYFRRVKVGLEAHLAPVGLAFLAFGVSELISLRTIFVGTENIDLYNLVAPFGPLWIGEHLVLLAATFILGRWVFGYLLKRLLSQLFMIINVTILVIFLLTTVSFTSLLLKKLQEQTLSRLETDVKVLSFALESKKAETVSDAQVLAVNSQVVKDVSEKNRPELGSIVEEFLLSKNQSFLVVVDHDGRVLARGEDKYRIGDSFSDDPLVKRALLGSSDSSVVVKEGVLAPEVNIRAAVPIKNGEDIIGVVETGVIVDNAFVDGVKAATNLEASVYGNNQLSATTFLAADGRSRANGIKEENSEVTSRVLNQGESFRGAVNILNTPYFAAYMPLFDVDNNPVGMLFVGSEQVGVLATAAQSIQLTFIIAAVLLVLSVVPAFLISRYLANQIH